MNKQNRLRSRMVRSVLALQALGWVMMLAACGNSPGYSYTVGGVITGLVGNGLVLQNNGGNDLNISANGSFSFSAAVPDGGGYAVTVKTQPAGLQQTCIVVNGTGVVHGMVTTVQVHCVRTPPRFAVNASSSVQFAYAANYTEARIAGYQVDAATGVTTANGSASAGTDPNAVTVATVGSNRYVYVPNSSGGTVSAYALGPDGTLSELPGSPFAAGTNPFSATLAAVGSNVYLYVPNVGSHNISAYALGSDGTLSELPGSPFAAGTHPHAVRVATVNGALYAYATNTGSGNITIYAIGADGALTQIAASPVAVGANPGAVEINAAGTYAYVANTGSNTVSVFAVSQSGANQGTLTLNNTVATASNPIVFKIDPTGAYAYAPCFRSNSISVYTIGSDGALTAGTAVSTGTGPYDVALVQIGGKTFAYAVNYNSNNISVYTVNSGGALSELSSGLSPVAAKTNPYAIVISKTPSDVYVAHVLNAGSKDISTYTIDHSTGALTPVGSAVTY